MPILELSDAQVVELVKQLPPERSGRHCWRWPRVPGSGARSGCNMRKGNCDVSARARPGMGQDVG